MINLNINLYDFLKYTLYFGRVNTIGNLAEVIFVLFSLVIVCINSTGYDTILLSRICMIFLGIGILFELAYKYFDSIFTF
ncbi:MAG: hypothetical protein KBF93_25725 [Leptospiraceae bacterium]|nr:hypothetical protein [Leptospiraceae bacterium]